MKPGQIIATKKINNLNIHFRLPKETDVKAMTNYVNKLSKEKTYISLQGEQVTLKEEEKYLKSLLKILKEKKGFSIQAWNKEELIGIVDLKSKDRAEKHIAELGISVKKEYRDYGIGTHLLKIALNQIPQILKNIKIVSLKAFADNDKAIHVYQKLGFRKYGELPKSLKRKNKYHNSILMYLDLKTS